MADSLRPVCTFVPQLYRKRKRKAVSPSGDDSPRVNAQTSVGPLRRSDRTARRIACQKLKRLLETEFTDKEDECRSGHVCQDKDDYWCPPSRVGSREASKDSFTCLNRSKSLASSSANGTSERSKQSDASLQEKSFIGTKRPRGRPRKTPLVCRDPVGATGLDAAANGIREFVSNASPMEQTPKRGRGRPRINPSEKAAGIGGLDRNRSSTRRVQFRMDSNESAMCQDSLSIDTIPSKKCNLPNDRWLTAPQDIRIASFFEINDDSSMVFLEAPSNPRPRRVVHFNSPHDGRGLLTLRLVRLGCRQVEELFHGPLSPCSSDEGSCDGSNAEALHSAGVRRGIWRAMRNFDYGGHKLVRLLCCKRGLLVETPYQTREDRRRKRAHDLSESELAGWDVRMALERILLSICASLERLDQCKESSWDTRTSGNGRKSVRGADRIYSFDLRDQLDLLAAQQITSQQFVDCLVKHCEALGRTSVRVEKPADDVLTVPDCGRPNDAGEEARLHLCHRCKRCYRSMDSLALHIQNFHQSVPRRQPARRTDRRRELPATTRRSPMHMFDFPMTLSWTEGRRPKLGKLKEELERVGAGVLELKPWCFVNGKINPEPLRRLALLLSRWVLHMPGVCVSVLRRSLQKSSFLAVLSDGQITELACGLLSCGYMSAKICTRAETHPGRHCEELGLFDKRPQCQTRIVDQSEWTLVMSMDQDIVNRTVFWYIQPNAQFDNLFAEEE